MAVKNLPYKAPTDYLFLDEKRKLGLVKRIQKQIYKFALTKMVIGLVTTWFWTMMKNVSQNCKTQPHKQARPAFPKAPANVEKRQEPVFANSRTNKLNYQWILTN